MNSVISAFKTKKNSNNQQSSVNNSSNNVSNDNKHNNLSMIANTLTTSSTKKKAINAQDNSYQYLRHIREIDTATKLLSPIVGADELLEADMLNFRPVTAAVSGVDVVDHVPLQTVRLTPVALDATLTDCNMNGGKNLTITPSENGNCQDSLGENLSDYTTMTNGQHSLTSSPTSQLNEVDDDESEHSITACTSTTSSSSSSDQSNSTVVHSPIAPIACAAVSAANNSQTVTANTTNASCANTLPSPAKSLNLSLNSSSNTYSSSPSLLSPSCSTISVSSNSNTSLALCNSGPSSCSSATGCDVSSNDYSQPSSPTMVTRRSSNSSTNSDYVPSFLKSSHVTLPIIMPNSSSSLASLPPNNQSIGGTPVNSAATTPKHTRYSKPRLSLSRFINHSMPSVHGRPNLSLAAGTPGSGMNGAGGAGNGSNPPKRPSTHQRNLSLDFRSMGILLPPVSQVTNTRINLTQHHRNRSLDSALQRIPEVEVSSPNAESENTFCTPSILGSTMCSKIVTTAANVTAALTTTQTPALTSSTTTNASTAAAAAAAVNAASSSAGSCAFEKAAIETVSTTEPTSILAQTQHQSAASSLSAGPTLGGGGSGIGTLHNDINNTVIVEPYCPSTRLRPKSSDSNTSSSSTVQRAASSASTASSNASSTNSSFASGSNNALAVINGSGHNNQNAKKREDLTSLGSDDSGIICGSDSDQISLNRIRHSHESLDSGEMDNEEECIDMLETTSMDEEYNMLQSDLCFYQSPDTDCRTLRPSKKKHSNLIQQHISNNMDASANNEEHTEGDDLSASGDGDTLSERQRYREMNMSQAAINMEKCKISSDSENTTLTENNSADVVDCPTPTLNTTAQSAATNSSNNSSSNGSKTPSTPSESSKNDVLFKNFFGATKNAIFRTAQSIIENHEKKNASKQNQKSTNEDTANTTGGASTPAEQMKSPTDISKKKEFFSLLTTNASKKAAAAAAAAALANSSASNTPASTPLSPAQDTASIIAEKTTENKDSSSSTECVEKTLNLQVPNNTSCSTSATNHHHQHHNPLSITKSSSISSLNKLKVPGVVKCFIKERPTNSQDLANQQKTEKGPSGLLRFFESPVFNIHFAIHYLFYSKEPGVLSFIGNKIFSFPDQEVDLYIPQLIVMYIQMDELAEVLDPYLTIRCRKSVDFSLKCLWLLEAYNYQHVDTMGSRKSQLALMKEIYSKKERKQLSKPDAKDAPAVQHSMVSPLTKKTHHRSQSDATVLLADSRRSSSNLSISNRLYQQPPYTTQTLPTTPAKLCLGDLTSGRAFDNGCTCFETVRGQVNDLLGHKTVCSCSAPKTAPQKEFMKALINVGKNLTNLPSKAEKTSALRMFLNLINKNLPARVWLPLYSDIPHHVVRITEEKTAVLNSKDKTPYIIYVEVVEVPDIYSSALIPKMMPSLRHTKSEEHLECGLSTTTTTTCQHHTHATCSRTSSCSSHSGSSAACRRKKEKLLSEPSERSEANNSEQTNNTTSSSSSNVVTGCLAPPQLNEDDVWSQEDDEITAQYLHMRKMRSQSERDAISQMSLDSCDSRDQGMPVLFNIGDVRTRHCNNLNCENTKSFSNDPEDPSAAALKEPWHEKEKQIRESSPYGHLSNWRLLSAIVKCGDDLRQELMATQLLHMFKIIWQEEHVDLWVRPYKIVCLSNDSGLIEPILNTVSLHQIKKNSNKSLRDYFIDEYGAPDSEAFKVAQKNFVQSCAAYCLISYLLQVKDRHNGNILLHSDGHIIHIDFGFILSISPKNLGFEQSPFKLTPEFVDVMGGTNSEHWREFNRLLLVGMMTARKHMDRIINFVEIMRSNAQLPCFKNGCSGTVQNLRKRFHMNLTEQEMERKVEQLVQDSLKSLSTKLYDGYQYYTNGIL